MCQKNNESFSDFFLLPPVSTTPVVHPELRIFETALMVFSGAWGKLKMKKPEVENLVALSL
jgi:hypothetical protein